MENYVHEKYDIAIVGAGHAGCEAALAAARMGLKTIMFTVSVDSVAMMPCNPNIGGSSKGHLVCELDALGGEMGKNIDKTYIQTKMLNESKGPAVHSLRAQADKQAYIREMRKNLENTPGLRIKQAEVSEILVRDSAYGAAPTKKAASTATAATAAVDDSVASAASPTETAAASAAVSARMREVCGVKTVSGATYECQKVVLCTGVYLKARCIFGDVSEYTGPNGLKAANHLTSSLLDLGIPVKRFKTGTPARVDGRTVDFSKMEIQNGDPDIRPFSFSNEPEDIGREQVPCYLTYTNEETHRIIRENIDRSPLFSGAIEGTGPRYCPSIEDKVMKFPDKDRHQIFIEPEGLYTNEVYLSGMSSSMPEDVQFRMIRTMPGFEHADIVRNAYAIEYDCIDATVLRSTLEFKDIRGLYAAGQINGSSGYEEAAVQGFMAGVNAALSWKGEEPLVLARSDAYIGVLIDDLVTKESAEPYRMMTSRAEYRLLLRQDNADLRLREMGHRIGLVSEEEYGKFLQKKQQIETEVERLENTYAGSNPRVNAFLTEHGSEPLRNDRGAKLSELIKRPELSYEMVGEIDDRRPELSWRVREQVNIRIKYEGYIARQMQQVEQFKKLESRRIPENFDFMALSGLRLEAKQKLTRMRPENIGQAGRISGVSPADVNVLLVYLERFNHGKQ